MRCFGKSDPLKTLLRDKSKAELTITVKKIEKKKKNSMKTNFSKNEK